MTAKQGAISANTPEGGSRRRPWPLAWTLVMAGLLWLWSPPAWGAGLEVAFDAANRLYEEGKYAEAAAAYEQMLAQGIRSASLYYNLGTAYYKAGQMGRAMVAYLRAERLTPRDPDLRANLQFVRKKVTGEERSPVPFWRRWFSFFTLNEGALLAAGAFWAFFLLLAVGEFRPAWKPRLHTGTLVLGALALALAACLGLAAYARLGETRAVVVVKEAVVRFGPLEESQSASQLPDGAEVTVLDAKDNWLQIRDRTGQVGWLKRDQVIVLSENNRLPSLP